MWRLNRNEFDTPGVIESRFVAVHDPRWDFGTKWYRTHGIQAAGGRPSTPL